ncbi:MAG: aminotransferase class V-fold PLP-dependent enzyme [bacterium]|nr:aminotransferase class V-fold PLP-dependent enzyme [bacterium]
MKPRPFDLPTLQRIRRRFHYPDQDPLSGPRVYLDAAAGSLRLREAVRTLETLSRWPDAIGRPGPGSRQASDSIERGVASVRDFLGAGDRVVMPAMSAVHAIFRAVGAAAGRAGDNIVTTDLDHPASFDAARFFGDRLGKQVRVARLDRDTGRVSASDIMALVDHRTDLVVVTHASNDTGAVVDVAEIVAGARTLSPEAIIIADGVQYVAHQPVDVISLGVDAYIFAPYKVFGIKGIGFGVLSERLAALPHWRLEAAPPHAWKLGSVEDATYAAWDKVVDYLEWLGGELGDPADRRQAVLIAMEATARHDAFLLNRFMYGSNAAPGLLDIPGVRVHGASDGAHNRICVSIFNFDAVDTDTAAELYHRAGIAVRARNLDVYSGRVLRALGCGPAIRVSTCHYTTPSEVDIFLTVTRAIASGG